MFKLIAILTAVALAPVAAFKTPVEAVPKAAASEAFDINDGCVEFYSGPPANSPTPMRVDLATEISDAKADLNLANEDERIVEEASDEVNEDPSDKPKDDLAEDLDYDDLDLPPIQPRRDPPRHAFRPRAARPDLVRP